MVVLKKMVFTNLVKLEDVNKKAKLILEKHKTLLQQKAKVSVDMSNSDSKSEHSLNTQQSKFEKMKLNEITDQLDKIFILSLVTFHTDGILTPEKIKANQQNIKVMVGCAAYKPAEFYLRIEESEG